MKKTMKWLGVSLGVFALVVVAVLLIAPKFISVEKYRPEIEKMVSEQTGRTFSMGDKMNLSLFPWAGISVNNAFLGNPKGFSDKYFVKVGSFEVRVKLLPLLSRDIQVEKLVLVRPEILLIQGKKTNNWTFETAVGEKKKTDAPKGEGPGIKSLHVGELALVDGLLIYKDLKAKTQNEVSKINLTLFDVALDKPVEFDFSTLVDNHEITAKGSFGPVGMDMKNETIDFNVSVKAFDELATKINGKILNRPGKPGAEFMMSVADFSPRKLMAKLGMEDIKTSDPKVLERLGFLFNASVTPDRLSLSKGKIQMDDIQGDYSLLVTNFNHPHVKVRGNFPRINLDSYLPPPQEGSDAKKAPGKSAPVDYKPLRSFDSDVKIGVGNLLVQKMELSNITLDLKSKRGVFRLSKFAFDTFGGNLTSSGVVDVSRQTPSVSMNMNTSGIQAGPAVKNFSGKDIIEGIMKTDVKISFSGDTPEAIKKTARGGGNILFEDGAVKGVDLSGMVRNVKTALGLEKPGGERPRTDFSELSVPFRMGKGILSIDGAKMASPLIRLNAGGTVDLIKEHLDLRIDPKLVATLKGQGDATKYTGLLVPVNVQGSFAKPSFKPDLKAMIKSEAAEKILGSDPLKKLKEKKDAKPVIDAAEGLLDSFLK